MYKVKFVEELDYIIEFTEEQVAEATDEILRDYWGEGRVSFSLQDRLYYLFDHKLKPTRQSAIGSSLDIINIEEIEE